MKKSLWFRFTAWWLRISRCPGICYDDSCEPPMPAQCVMGLLHGGWCVTECGYEFDSEEEELQHAAYLERRKP